MHTEPEGFWLAYRQERERVVANLDDNWFRVPYRSKEEALRQAFGQEWALTYVHVHAEFLLPCYLLTRPESGWRILTTFPDPRWYPRANADAPTGGSGRPVARGRTRALRSALRDVVENAVGADSIAGLVLTYGARAESGNNHQAGCYVPALFDTWLDERGMSSGEAASLRLLAALGGYRHAIEMMGAPESLQA